MKIVFIINSLTPGGAEKMITKLANDFCEKGNEIHLLSFAKKSELPFYPLNPQIHYQALNHPGNFNKGFFTKISSLLKQIWVLRKVLQKIKPDCVVSFLHRANVLSLVATMQTQIPCIVSERTDPYQIKLSPFFRLSRFIFYFRAKAIVLQSQHAASYFQSFFIKKIHILPNPVPSFSNKIEKVTPKIQHCITLGRLSEEKDPFILLSAFEILEKKHPQIHLSFYGEGVLREKIQKWIEEKGYENKIQLKGQITDITKAFAKADLFLFPSHFEGFPNALSEAMAYGLPVIASACPGNQILITHAKNGYLFPIRDLNALVKIWQMCLENSEDCHRIRKEAKKISLRFCEKHILKQWGDLIRSVS